MLDSKRIAKNTIFLYFRMILVMAVALYTSRVVLGILGASDYGLYNVVGGVVTMFAFVNGVLSSGTSRFITYELGMGDDEKLRDIFNVALVSHIGLALIVFILAETAGLWFINTQLVFPPERTFAVNVVYQLSVLTLMLQFTQLPYTATIIAHEKMNVYAYVGLLDVGLKLLMILLLNLNRSLDNLILYAILIFCVQVVTLVIYRIYCLRHYQESHWRLSKDKQKYKDIFSYAGWDVIGSLCVITQGQGVNILLNIYFGPVVNAARAICYQVEGAFNQLTGNFMTALTPQIVKSYAKNEIDDMLELIKDGSKYGFFLLAVFLMPVMYKIDYVLNLWLIDVPAQTALFVLIILTNTMIRVIARPVISGVHATGRIKRLDIYAGGIGLMPLPLIWVLFEKGFAAHYAFWVILLWGVFANIAEIIIFKVELPEFQVIDYCISVYGRCFIVAAGVLFIDNILVDFFANQFLSVCLYFALTFALNASIVFMLGFNRRQRGKILNVLYGRLKQLL